MNAYAALESAVLALHLLWIAWILGGWLLTRGRRALTALHIASLAWGIAIELGPWPCPLTLAEQWFQARSGQTPYHETFVAHYLGKLIYPDLPETVVARSGAAVCTLILAIYGARWLHHHRGV